MEVTHHGLGRYRIVRGPNRAVVERMAAAQWHQWEEQYRKKLESERQAHQRMVAQQSRDQAKQAAANEKQRIALHRERMKQQAFERTQAAQEAVESVAGILKATLTVNDQIAWGDLMDRSVYSEPRPVKRAVPPPHSTGIPLPPSRTDARYAVVLTVVDKLSPARRKVKEDDAAAMYQRDLDAWNRTKTNIEASNARLLSESEQAQKAAEAEFERATRAWEAAKTKFLIEQQERNREIQELATAYHQRDPIAIKTYCELVLSRSLYPDSFPQQFEIDFSSENGIVAVEYQLPAPDQMPTIKEVKYVQSKDAFETVALAKGVLADLYDSVLYQIALRTMHELFEADVVGAVSAICFNGWVKTLDASTGQEADACIVSVLAQREEFMAINLAQVDPKACFKKLRGVGAAKLHALSPVAPVMRMDTNDKRFVSSYSVTQNLEESTNLAAIPWEDFEHLVREVFEREFATSGGEVKVTRASRDGGVDAVAFDPDPIRGGKIVIQAKRYTGIVGVSAVRDLYGTLMNEGATKGILVTTSDYGPDAYEFAKGKPLTLLSGGNLLHLLAKHGHNARIDLAEAKRAGGA